MSILTHGYYRHKIFLLLCLLTLLVGHCVSAAARSPGSVERVFPPSLESYQDTQMSGLGAVLQHRIEQQPLNLIATLLFLGAVVHTFFTHKFLHWARILEERHEQKEGAAPFDAQAHRACKRARLLHFLGEVEAVFGIWCLPLFVLLVVRLGWQSSVDYFNHGVSYVEPVFVVVIMAIASTRPVLLLAESLMSMVARLGGNTPAAWWLAILTLGPVLGSLITEPAAMTISAMLLAKQFYQRKPNYIFAYATLGLLFVNVSVGGVLTHFAAPPVLMVAGPWGWNTPFMLRHFGWLAMVAILISNTLYFLVFRKHFAQLQSEQLMGAAAAESGNSARQQAIPVWITLVHVGFMGWSVLSAHFPALLIGGFLFFLAFYEVTHDFQSELQLRTPILVGFFLGGLVVHGGLQQWWIGPLLRQLSEVPLMLGAIVLTSVNDNAAITYLATLVPGLTDSMKFAVVAGAVTGGGLTVIANAPNPAGQAILGRFFPDGIAPLGLLLGALPATVMVALVFLLLG